MKPVHGFLIGVVVMTSVTGPIMYSDYLEHEKFKICLDNPRCEYHRKGGQP